MRGLHSVLNAETREKIKCREGGACNDDVVVPEVDQTRVGARGAR